MRERDGAELLDARQVEAAPGDVYLLAAIDQSGAISRTYLLVVEAEMDTQALLAELLGDDCSAVEMAGEEGALVFLRSSGVPCLLLVQLRVSTAEAGILADVIRDCPLESALQLCASAAKPN